MCKIKKYKMELEVLTPLHISGADYKSKLNKKEYIFDKNTKTLTLIDSNKFIDFLIQKNLFDQYVSYIQDPKAKLSDFFWEHRIDGNQEEYQKKVYRKVDTGIERMNDIRLLICDIQGKPFIPGSSIKGALMNLLLVDYLIKNPEEFTTEKEQILEKCQRGNLDKKEKEKEKVEEMVDKIQEEVFYPEDKSLKRLGISISDTFPCYNTKTNFYQDIDEKRAAAMDGTKSSPMPIAREYIMSDSKFEFELTLNFEILEKSRLDIKNYEDLISAVENATEYLIKTVLEDKDTSIVPSLILGANTGFHQKTIIHALFPDPKDCLKVTKQLLHKGKKNQISNHLSDKVSPRVVNRVKIKNNNVLAGLVKLTKIEEKEVGRLGC